jgi:hypothetical protein
LVPTISSSFFAEPAPALLLLLVPPPLGLLLLVPLLQALAVTASASMATPLTTVAVLRDIRSSSWDLAQDDCRSLRRN